jgi:hypothetical protein
MAVAGTAGMTIPALLAATPQGLTAGETVAALGVGAAGMAAAERMRLPEARQIQKILEACGLI